MGLASLGPLLCSEPSSPAASLAPAVSSQHHRGSRGGGGGPAENTALSWTLHTHFQRAPATPVTLDHRRILYKVEGLLGNPTHRYTPNQQVVCRQLKEPMAQLQTRVPALVPHPAPRWPWLALPLQCSLLLASSIIFLKDSSGHSGSHQSPTLSAH